MEKIISIEEEIKRIKEILIKDNYQDKYIDYEQMQYLHKKYAEKIEEKIFAINILGIAEKNYDGFKNRKKRAKILKRQTNINEEEIKELKSILIKEGYKEKTIEYKELQEIHRKYADKINEKVFATEILGITEGHYNSMKYRMYRGKILKKEYRTMDEDQIEKIQEKLKKEGYKEKVIDYEELQFLHNKYAKDIKESKFATQVLLLGKSSYESIKNLRARGRILRDTIKINDEQARKIKEKIIEDGYEEKIINYEELSRLHKKYAQQIEEKNFAIEILGLTYENYRSVKSAGTRCKILKKEKEELKQEEIEEIKEKLKSEKYEGELIDYSQLQKIHKTYAPKSDERIFAIKVLCIKEGSYYSMKNRGSKGRILKKNININQEQIEKIKNKLKKQNYEGRLINYKQLQKIYKEFDKEIEEKTFALEVLGLNSDKYYQMKNNGRSCVIKDKSTYIKADFIRKNNVKEKRYYTTEEIEKICEINKITKEEFIKYVILNLNSNALKKITEEYEKTIKENGKIWIGKTNLSKDFFDKNTNRIYEYAEGIVRSYIKTYKLNKMDIEDYVQEAVIYVEQNCGDIEKNFVYKKELFRAILLNRIKRVIDIRICENKRYESKNKSSIKKRFQGDKEYEYISDKENIQLEIEDKIIGEGAIQKLKQLVEEGCEKKEALEKVVGEFGLTKEELLVIMGDYLNKYGKINISKKVKKQIEEHDV